VISDVPYSKSAGGSSVTATNGLYTPGEKATADVIIVENVAKYETSTCTITINATGYYECEYWTVFKPNVMTHPNTYSAALVTATSPALVVIAGSISAFTFGYNGMRGDMLTKSTTTLLNAGTTVNLLWQSECKQGAPVAWEMDNVMIILKRVHPP
jgi:hypothetical protein